MSDKNTSCRDYRRLTILNLFFHTVTYKSVSRSVTQNEPTAIIIAKVPYNNFENSLSFRNFCLAFSSIERKKRYVTHPKKPDITTHITILRPLGISYSINKIDNKRIMVKNGSVISNENIPAILMTGGQEWLTLKMPSKTT